MYVSQSWITQANSMKKIRIFIIEDNRVLRDGLTTLLDGQSDMKVATSIGSGNNVLLNMRKVKPHIMLLDLGLWSHNPRSVLEGVKKDFPEVKIIGMGLIPSQTDIIESVEAGASGFILKDATVKEFLGTIRSVAKGIKILPPLLAGSLFSRVIENALKKGKGKLTSAVRMTKREREIIALIADGMSNKEIARQLTIATHTVKSHVHNIMEKLALHSRLQIAKYTHEENP
jgi:DNA-binding NarL/FixJ family response regulator